MFAGLNQLLASNKGTDQAILSVKDQNQCKLHLLLTENNVLSTEQHSKYLGRKINTRIHTS